MSLISFLKFMLSLCIFLPLNAENFDETHPHVAYCENLTSLSSHDDFVLYTVPKAGTHLIAVCLHLMTGSSQQFFNEYPFKDPGACQYHLHVLRNQHYFLMSHDFFSQDMAELWSICNCKIFLMLRDPRDMTLSMISYIMNGYDVGGWSRNNWFGQLSLEEQINLTMERIHGCGVEDHYQRRLDWGKMPQSCCIYFENLVGPKGGGTITAQLKEMRKIANHIHLQISDKALLEIGDQMFGHCESQTFHKGAIGKWKQYFSDENKQFCKEILGDLLIELGYESNYAW